MIIYSFIVQHFSCTMKWCVSWICHRLWVWFPLNQQRGSSPVCTGRSCFSPELHSTWYKSSALINTNAPVQWESALLRTINQMTDFTFSALTRTLRVTAKALSCSWTRLRSRWVFLINKSQAIVLQIISNIRSISFMCCESELITSL